MTNGVNQCQIRGHSMKNLKLIAIIVIGLLQCTEQFHASGGKTAKVISPVVKLATTGTAAFSLAPKTKSYAEGYQYQPEHVATHTTTVINPIQNYKQNNSFKSNYAEPVTTNISKINTKSSEILNDQISNPQDSATPLNQSKNMYSTQQPAIPFQEAITPTSKPNIPLNPLNIANNLRYQKPIGNKFQFHVKPNFQSKIMPQPKQEQLLLTYDPTYTPEPITISPKNNELAQNNTEQNLHPTNKSATKVAIKKLTPEEIDALKNSVQAQEKRQARQEKLNKTKDISAHDLALNNKQRINLFNTSAQEQPQINVTKIIEQQYIGDVVNKASSIINNWYEYRTEMVSEKAHKKMLENDILDLVSIKDHNKLRSFENPQLDLKAVDVLIKKNKKDPYVTRGLQSIRKIIQDNVASNNFIPLQANSLISRYYTPSMRQDIFSFVNEQPIYNANRAITNMPKIESIIQISLDNPTAQSFKALQTSLKATQSAIDATTRNSSLFSDQSVLAQLKLFEKSLTTTLQDPSMTQFQSWGSYATSALSSAGTSIFNATIAKVPLTTALTGGHSTIEKVAPYANTLINASGVKDRPLSQLAKDIGLVESKNQAPQAWPEGPSKPKERSLYEQLNFDIKPQDAKTMSSKTNANKAIADYYSPAVQDYILATMKIKPIINPENQTVINMPSVDTIFESALTRPNQKIFNTLEVIHEATKVAINAARKESSYFNQSPLLKELQNYDKTITTILNSPQYRQYQSYTTQAASYAAGFIPSMETVLNTTGLGNVTLNTAINTVNTAISTTNAAIDATGLRPVVNTAGHLTQAAVTYSGIPTMTIGQALNKVGVGNQ